MINYTFVEKKVAELESITCDVCKKEYKMYNIDIDPKQRNLQDQYEIEEFIRIQKDCGFFSVFGDETTINIDICQHCFQRLLGEYIRTT
jgi:hypothetical protein